MNKSEENRSETETNEVSKEGMAIFEVGSQMNEFAALFAERMISVEAQQHVTQDLLKTILIGQGHSREKLEQESLANYREYVKRVAAAYQEKLKLFQDRSEESAASIAGTNATPLNQFARKLLIAAEHKENAIVDGYQIAQKVGDPQLSEAVKEVFKNQLENGLHYGDAFATRPDVFTEDFITAVKAADKDGDLVKNLRIFLKYDN